MPLTGQDPLMLNLSRQPAELRFAARDDGLVSQTVLGNLNSLIPATLLEPGTQFLVFA
jgi:hypothetical protein